MRNGFRRTRWILLLAVAGVVGVAAVYLLFSEGRSYSPELRVQADLASIRTQLEIYKTGNGFYPTTEQGLTALRVRPWSSPVPERWQQVFVTIPGDPWDNDYVYRLLGPPESGPIDLYSRGPDGVESADDIRLDPNWTPRAMKQN